MNFPGKCAIMECGKEVILGMLATVTIIDNWFNHIFRGCSQLLKR